MELLARWQRRINLVGGASLADVWRRHLLDSAQLHRLVATGAVVLDLGSGAGFPGMVLAILGGSRVHLVERDARKCAFLSEVNREAHAGAVIHRTPIDELAPFAADVITARACAPLDRLLGLAERFLRPGSRCLFLKGRTVEQELTEAAKKWIMTVTRFASASDPSGVVLELEGIARRHGP